jgi:hypothetical protein
VSCCDSSYICVLTLHPCWLKSCGGGGGGVECRSTTAVCYDGQSVLSCIRCSIPIVFCFGMENGGQVAEA